MENFRLHLGIMKSEKYVSSEKGGGEESLGALFTVIEFSIFLPTSLRAEFCQHLQVISTG